MSETMYGYRVVDTPDGRMLQIPVGDVCREEDHHWEVKTTWDGDMLDVLVIPPQAAIRIPREIVLDQANPDGFASMLTDRMALELLDEMVPCHLPEIAAKARAAFAKVLEGLR